MFQTIMNKCKVKLNDFLSTYLTSLEHILIINHCNVKFMGRDYFQSFDDVNKFYKIHQSENSIFMLSGMGDHNSKYSHKYWMKRKESGIYWIVQRLWIV